jgi:hypothetical protein
MRWAVQLAALAFCGALCAQAAAQRPYDAKVVGGIEPVRIDGQQYFFGYSFRMDQVLTPLFADAESAAAYATTHLAQRDGRKDKAFWLAQARETLDDPQLSDRDGTVLDLSGVRRDLASLRSDPKTLRILPGLDAPAYLIYLLEMNCQWPDEPQPARVTAAAKRLGLDMDDTSGWLEYATYYLTGREAIPRRASFNDAASVYLWYLDTLLVHQRYDWSKELGLRS